MRLLALERLQSTSASLARVKPQPEFCMHRPISFLGQGEGHSQSSACRVHQFPGKGKATATVLHAECHQLPWQGSCHNRNSEAAYPRACFLRVKKTAPPSVLPVTGCSGRVFPQSTSLRPGAGLPVSRRQRLSNPQRTASMSKIAALADCVAAISF